ncbi:MAG: cytochrome c oxidase assembly protein [Verrucomicrobiota bacterium]|nr:cytochrome c oxidase assembly protein [Verrucomicrobiota bacterium]
MNSPVNFSHWHTEPALIGGLLLVSWCYTIIIGPYRTNICPGLPFIRKYAYWFFLSVTTFYLAVGSPLDAMGENFLFSAHMIQHNILMYVCPLFFLLSLPEDLVDKTFEKNPALEKIAKFIFHPIIAGLSFTLIFSFWHIGAFYEAAIRDKTIHMAEHLSMYFSSIAMWWPICGPSKRVAPMRFGPQMLYVLALMLGQTPIFAFLTFSKDVLYDTYFYAERIINLSPLEDQKTGGVLMKLANMAVSVGVLSSIFYRWSKLSTAKAS